MNFTYFLTPDEVKQNGLLNANVDAEYIEPSLQEAQSVFCREILGDLLYKSITNKINSDTLTGKYQTLLNDYIKPYMGYKMLSLIALPLNFKLRNMGVISQYGDGVTSASVKDTAYIQKQYDSKAEFYANRLTTYLQKNAADFPEYGYSDDNVTQPTETQNVTTIYLGGGRKKGCGCNTSTPQATATTVEWDNIQNRPNFAQVAYSNDYNDLDNKPEIPSVEGYATEEWVQEQGYSTFDGDYNSLTNKPTIPTVPTNVSAFTNDAGYTTEAYVNNAIQQVEGEIPTVPTNVSAFTNDAGYLTQHQSLDGYATEEWVSEQGFSTFSGSYEDLTDKPTIPTVNDAVLTIKQGGVTKGTFTANSNQNIEIDLEAGGAAQVQADWNQSDNTAVDYIKNKPTIPTVPTNVSAFTNDAGYLTQHQSLQGLATENYVDSAIQQVEQEIPTVPANVSAFTNDAGYLTQHQSLTGYATENWVQQQGYTTFDGDYNSLTNKPTIPAAQVNSDWNANSGVAQILNKPTIPTKTSELTNDSGFTTFDGDYNSLTNKPTIPTVPANVSAFTNDAGYLTQHQSLQGYATETWVQQQGYSTFDGDYNSLTNKPTIPAAQVQSDWNANSGMGEILNKPSMTAETWTFTLSDNTTVTKTVWLQ